MSIGESPAKEQFPKELYDHALHSHLQNGDFVLMASDMCGMGELTPGNSVDVIIRQKIKIRHQLPYQ